MCTNPEFDSVAYMRIAQIAPLVERVPPPKYGGTERVVFSLTEELVRRGHDVTLFASGDSITSAHLDSVFPTALRGTGIEPLYGANVHVLRMLGRAYSEAPDRFDIIHDHTGALGIPFAQMSKVPVVSTFHGNVPAEEIALYEEFTRAHAIAISHSMKTSTPVLKNAVTVYNGLAMTHYPFSEKPGEYLLYVGRICYDKGTHSAVEVARRLNMPLIIAAKLEKNEPEQQYFHTYVKPFLSETVRWVGEVDEAERNRLMASARAFLHPIHWDEPFGLTMIEAMATGTPVVAFRRGSVPEIIVDGVSGFVVDTIDEMVEAVKKTVSLDRAACRAYALTNFNERRMADGYESLYQHLIGKKMQPITIFPGIVYQPRLVPKDVELLASVVVPS